VGLPALAISLRGDDEKSYAAAAFMRELVGELRAKQHLKPGLFLNVNFPAGECKVVRVTRLSTTAWALVRGYAALSPMTLDVTATQAIQALQGLDLQPAAASALK
jgi:hypothetical protein